MFLKNALVFALVIFFATIGQHAVAQKQIKKTNQQWLQYYTQYKINSQWSVLADAGVRQKEQFSGWSQMLIRGAAGYKLHDQAQVSAGMALLSFYKEGEISKYEYRPYQELILKQPFEHIKLQHRVRVEERFFGGFADSQDSSSFNFRFRYRLMAEVFLMDLVPESDQGDLSFNIGNEVMLNAGKHIMYNQFDNNRFLLGLNYDVCPNLSVSMTYCLLYAQSNEPLTFSKTHIIWCGIKHQLSRH